MADKGIIFSAPMVRALLAGRKTQTRRLFKARFGFGEPKNLRDHGVGDYSGKANDPFSWGYPFAEDGADMQLGHWPYLSGYDRGDRLYVREACRAEAEEMGFSGVRFLADNVWRQIQNTPEAAEAWGKLYYYGKKPADHVKGIGKGVPSIHMPRWASRMTLAVTEVRIERVQSISEADAIAEGIAPVTRKLPPLQGCPGALRERTIFEWDTGWSESAVPAYAALWNSLHTDEGERWEDNPWVVAVSFDVNEGNIDAVPV